MSDSSSLEQPGTKQEPTQLHRPPHEDGCVQGRNPHPSGWGGSQDHSPLTPADLTDAELERLRLARPGMVVMLNQLSDGTFDINGKAASMCVECSATFIAARPELTRLTQNHLSHAHNISAPLLPSRTANS